MAPSLLRAAARGGLRRNAWFAMAPMRPQVLGLRHFAGSETHGGDDIHRVSKLVCDFSVTTNCMGPVPKAVEAVKKLVGDTEDRWTTPRGGDVKAIMEDEGTHILSCPAIEHYPNRQDQELDKLVADFLRPECPQEAAELQKRLVFGNGASEVIDLVARMAPPGPYCTSPFSRVQYREYERACKNAGREKVSNCSDAVIVCLVNPTNPTGDFVERPELESWIENNAAPGSWVIVDESMLFWAGPDWHRRGVSSTFVEKMQKKHIHVFQIYSWTKIFSCTGMRIGSVVCPTPAASRQVQAQQVPWSVNVFARAYLRHALQDREYLERTWTVTPSWRDHIVTRLQRIHPSWKFLGHKWTSWVWIDTGDAQVAEDVYKTSLACGCPVRHGAAGYDLPTFIRVAVRRPYDFAVLYQALLQRQCATKVDGKAPFGTYADVDPNVVEGVHLVHIDDLKPHEEVVANRADKLKDYLEALPLKILPSIIVDSQYQVVIDGHHRLELFRLAGMTIVPAVFVRYDHEDVLVHPPGQEVKDVTKETVIFNALKGQRLKPKSTQHMVRARGGELLPIIVLAPQIAELSKNGDSVPKEARE